MVSIEAAQTIPELTNYEYNELCYNSAGTLIVGNYVSRICFLLNRCDIEVPIIEEYNDVVAIAVSQFQEMTGLNITGNLNTSTFQAMILYADKMEDSISSDEESVNETVQELSESPHYNSFFDDEKYKMHRRNHKDVKIVFGNKSITKTIKNAFMLGVSLEVDTSGNPISEVYEFIAQDVVESDEITDANKYTGIEHATSSDVQYNFESINVK